MSARLFLLANTMIRSLETLSLPPRSGDVVCLLRLGQDPHGEASERLQARGIALVWGDDLVDKSVSEAIDETGTRFLQEWNRIEGRDFATIDGFSLGPAMAMEIARSTNPRVLIRTGEILRRLIDRYPDATEVICDIRDGSGVFEVLPDYLPLRCVVSHVASSKGRAFTSIPSADPIPPALRRPPKIQWPAIVRSLAGALRPQWLLARRRFNRNRKRRPRPILYMFLGREQTRLAVRLAASGRFHVVCDGIGVDGADIVRQDQFFALPGLREVQRVWNIQKQLTFLAAEKKIKSPYAFAGIDYGPILFEAVRSILQSQVLAFMVVLAQSRRLQKFVGFDALFVNGGGAEAMGNLIALNRNTSIPVFLMPHGMDLQRFSYPMAAVDHPHVTYLAYGEDHADYFRTSAGSSKLKTALVGNPITVAMLPLRCRRPTDHGKRLLVLSFGHLEFWNAARVYACDQYYLEIFEVVRSLIADGWSVTCRSHPYQPQDLERRFATEFGLVDSINWSDRGDFGEVLTEHDVVVSNLTSAYYQSLYAGWPTIFFEPDYRKIGSIEGIETDPMLTGLPTARDIDRPVTNDPKELERMIRETLSADSPTSKFPEKLSAQYARRFIGPNPSDADRVAAAFIEESFFGPERDQSRLAQVA